jgi:hypothetical protein
VENYQTQIKLLNLTGTTLATSINGDRAETSGNQLRAAKLLGITGATRRKRIAKFGIEQRVELG